MPSPTYFWKEGAVHKYLGHFNLDAICEAEFTGCFAVDTELICIEMRYGKYIKNTGWVYVPIEQFPKKFRIHLLLLGIT